MEGKSDIINDQRRIYGGAFETYGDHTSSTFQPNEQAQHLRFAKLIQHLSWPTDTPRSVHDVGSGFCDLHAYMKARKIPHHYSGTEIVEPMNEVARKRHPGIEIYNRNLLDVEKGEQYDYVVLSGTLNLPGKTDRDRWQEFCIALINKMFLMARCAIAFNFLTTFNTFANPDLHYFDPRELFGHCVTTLSRFTLLDHAYPLYEATIVVSNEAYVAASYPDPSFGKYFASQAPPNAKAR